MCRIKTIYSDMDGVFTDLEGAVVSTIRTRYPWVWLPSPEERNTFYLDEQLKPEDRHLVAEIIAEPGFFLNLKPIPGAIEGLNKISRIEHVNLVICTSPLQDPTYCVPEKYEWVDRYLGPKFVRNMMMTRDKTTAFGDVMLEDNPDVKGVNVPFWKLFLHDRPHNRHSSLPRFNWDPRDDFGFKWLYEYLMFE